MATYWLEGRDGLTFGPVEVPLLENPNTEIIGTQWSTCRGKDNLDDDDDDDDDGCVGRRGGM